MTEPVQFFIPGAPGSKGRPRFGHGRAFTPATTVAAEKSVKFYAHAAMRGRKLLEGPLDLRMYVTYLHPQSWSAKKRAATVWKTSKPDLDNLEKLTKDACNRVVWVDDAQVAQVYKSKKYGDEEGVLVVITPLLEGGI